MSSDAVGFLDTPEGEISLFRSIMRTRPVGIHRHLHILAIHNSIYRETGFKVPMQEIWAKLRRMYDLEALESAESNGDDANSSASSPSPEANIQLHPTFKEEFNPAAHDESFESYFALRRVRPASSTPTPSPSPPQGPSRTGSAPNSSIKGSDVGKRQRHKEKLKLAGLDDSDSSALTQSGDEVEESSPLQDPSGPGTEAGEEGDVEMGERSSPEPVSVVKPTKGQKAGKKGASARTRSSTTAASARPTKKRKR